MRSKYVKILLVRDLRKIESELRRAFQTGDDAKILLLINIFADKAQEYQEFVASLK